MASRVIPPLVQCSLRKGQHEKLSRPEKGWRLSLKTSASPTTSPLPFQEWGRNALTGGDRNKPRPCLLSMLQRFPKLPELKEVAKNHAKSAVLASETPANSSSADRHRRSPRIPRRQERCQGLVLGRVRHVGRETRQGEKVAGCGRCLRQGTLRLPGDPHIKNNLIYTVQEWARDAGATGDKAKDILLAQPSASQDSGSEDSPPIRAPEVNEL